MSLTGALILLVLVVVAATLRWLMAHGRWWRR